MSSSLLGDIKLRDKNPGSEKTSAQVFSTPNYDSRLYQSYQPFTYAKIRELKNDPTIQLARWAVLAPMVHTPWIIEQNKKLATQEMVDFVHDNLRPLRDMFLVQAVFGTLDYGWNPFEIVYKPEDGRIWIDNFKALLHHYTTILIYINNGKFAGFTNETYFPDQSEKVIQPYAQLTNFEVEGTDWYGYSVYKSLNKICDSWDTVEATSNRYDKKIAGASWVVYYPVGETKYKGVLTPNDTIAQYIIADLQGSGCVAIPDEWAEWTDDMADREAEGKWRIELIEAKSSAQSAFIDRQKYLDALKMRALGFPERSIMEGSHGTKEEASVHTDIALSIVDSRHRLLTNQLNLYSLPHLMRFNYGKKYEYALRVTPAPLVDAQFGLVKDIYRLLLQNQKIAEKEFSNLNMTAIKTELNLPNINEDYVIPPDPPKVQPGQNKTSNTKEDSNA